MHVDPGLSAQSASHLGSADIQNTSPHENCLLHTLFADLIWLTDPDVRSDVFCRHSNTAATLIRA